MGAGLLRNGRGGVGSCRVGAPRGGVAEHGSQRGAVATIGAGKHRGQRALASGRHLLSAVVGCCCGPRMLVIVVSRLLSVVMYLSDFFNYLSDFFNLRLFLLRVLTKICTFADDKFIFVLL